LNSEASTRQQTKEARLGADRHLLDEGLLDVRDGAMLRKRHRNPKPAVLAGSAWRRAQEGTLARWLFGRLRVLTEMSSLRRHRRDLRGDPRAWQVEAEFWGDAGP
jgi:hypothetical protein